MKIRDFLRRIWAGRAVRGKPSNRRSSPALRPVLARIARTQAQELSCDEAYALLDVMADAVGRGEDTAALMPLVQHHLEMCPDCQEEFTVLLRSMEVTKP